MSVLDYGFFTPDERLILSNAIRNDGCLSLNDMINVALSGVKFARDCLIRGTYSGLACKLFQIDASEWDSFLPVSGLYPPGFVFTLAS